MKPSHLCYVEALARLPAMTRTKVRAMTLISRLYRPQARMHHIRTYNSQDLLGSHCLHTRNVYCRGPFPAGTRATSSESVCLGAG